MDKKGYKALFVKEKGDKCAMCGNKFPACCYDFHHINPDSKKKSITALLNGKKDMKIIRAELKKCIMLCANCHRIVHHGYNDI